jgi:hypothetical protein
MEFPSAVGHVCRRFAVRQGPPRMAADDGPPTDAAPFTP